MSKPEKIVNAWSQQDTTFSRDGKIFFEGRTIYSYGYNFPIAVFINSSVVVINSNCYSTGKLHQKCVKNAVTHKKVLFAARNVCRLLANNDLTKGDLKKKLNEYLDFKLEYLFLSLKVQRLHKKTKISYITAFEALVISTQEIASIYKIKLSKKFTTLIAQLYDNLPDAMESLRKAELVRVNERRKENKKHQDQYEIDAQSLVKKFLLGEKLTYMEQTVLMRSKKTYLRILPDNKTMSTSHEAEFPIAHAIRAFEFIEKCVKNKTDWEANGRSLNLGNFHINKIESNGNVSASCHYVEYSEIERIAKLLGLL